MPMKNAWLFTILLSRTVTAASISGADSLGLFYRLDLSEDWQMQSAAVDPGDGSSLSRPGSTVENWYSVRVPMTVLHALTEAGVYPDVRFGMNAFRVPDASGEFNEKEDLARYSHLPDHRNPWTDPWWFRREFTLPQEPAGARTWLHFDSINYRAEVWLNGNKVADRSQMVSMNQRFTFDVSRWVLPGSNTLAVKVWRVDHVGSPGTQLVPLANTRFEDHVSDGPMDYAVQLAGGYDCFPSVPDRYTGILQDVWVETSGPIVIRDPFVVTELPLPRTDSTRLKISATVVNASDQQIEGILEGSIAGTELQFEVPVTLAAGEARLAVFDPAPVMSQPKLWWPNGYGAQPQYDLTLRFIAHGRASHTQTVRFGVRQIASEMHERGGHYGRRILINGQRIYARGGYIQPDALWDWSPDRVEAEIRYYAGANLNLIYFEDIANPPDHLFDLCDRYGVMIGQCFYGCSWMQSGSKYPGDVPLVVQCTRDILKRYRNHPSLVMYMASNEGFTREEVYRPWRASVIELDGSRFWVPSNGMPNEPPEKVQPWFREDVPTGMTDLGSNTYGWEEPSEYYRRVREVPNWMFMTETGSASLPPWSSLKKFIPDLGKVAPGPTFPLDTTWAHHGANRYYQPYDAAVRRVYGEPITMGDYIWQGHLATADQHRAMFEAVNHRLWDITSGFTQWKLNSAWPDVQWQIFDWFLKPMVSYYFIKRANAPIHIQLGLLEPTVTIVNHTLQPRDGLKARARVLDPAMRVLFEKETDAGVAADSYRDLFELPKLSNLPPVYFVRLDLTDDRGTQVADNLYWFPSATGGSMQALRDLPPVRLESVCQVETRGPECTARVAVANPTRQLAFFVQLALTQCRGGAEILPVLWEDNYFSLLPGESREITARFTARNAGKDAATLEVGGWNVEGNFDCDELTIDAQRRKVGEPATVTATISNTFLDGSRVPLRVDGQIRETQWAWARDGRSQVLAFSVTFDHPGQHTLEVGNKRLEVAVQP
ncbi:MAG: glycoside hydrolase family 2 protein [Solirubrobacterales bacterium]